AHKMRLMDALAWSFLRFVLSLGGIFLGAWLRRAWPEHQLSKVSQDVVGLGTGLIGTIAALVLGLLIAAAKSSFDTQSTQITQITANMILLDNLLAEYGPEARPIPNRCAVSLETSPPLGRTKWVTRC